MTTTPPCETDGNESVRKFETVFGGFKHFAWFREAGMPPLNHARQTEIGILNGVRTGVKSNPEIANV